MTGVCNGEQYCSGHGLEDFGAVFIRDNAIGFAPEHLDRVGVLPGFFKLGGLVGKIEMLEGTDDGTFVPVVGHLLSGSFQMSWFCPF